MRLVSGGVGLRGLGTEFGPAECRVVSPHARRHWKCRAEGRGSTLKPCEACWRAEKPMSEPIFSAVYSYKTFFLLFFASATRRAQSVQDHPPLIVVWLR
jgi:hypothetical protein